MSDSAASSIQVNVKPQLRPVSSRDPSLETYTAQPESYQHRELQAQEDMAHWAMWMFIVAVATFGITSLGTLLIWRQVKFTRKAVEEATAGTAAMREANAIAREMGEAQARCYLSAKDVTFRIDNLGTPHVGMNVFNSGQSPARHFRWAFQVRLADLADDWVWQNLLAEPGGGRDISAQQQEMLELGLIDGQPMPQGQLSDLLLGPEARITVSIAAAWVDVFGKEVRETWRFQGSGPCMLNTDFRLFADIPAVV